MAHEGPFAASEDAGQLARSRDFNCVPDQVHTAIDSMKRSAAHPARDCRAATTESLQLPGGHNAELPPGDPGDGLIVELPRAALTAQKVTSSAAEMISAT